MIQESYFLAGERPAGKGWRRGPSLLLSAGPGGGGLGGPGGGQGREGEVALPGPLRDQMQEGKARCPAGGAGGRWVPRADMGEGPEAQAGLGQGAPPWRRPHVLRTRGPAQVGACREAPSVCGSGYVKHLLQIFKVHSLCVLGV